MNKEIENFFIKIEEIYLSKKPFVVYRKPNEQIIFAYMQTTDELFELDSFKQTGFIFAPFENNEKRVIFPIEKSVIFSVKINNDIVIGTSNSLKKLSIVSDEKLKEKHIALVEKGVEYIKNKNAQKIVLSRKEKIEYTDFDVVHTLKKMLDTYKNAFVYLWYHPKVGLWMGATPERLINITKNQFKTMALAGTQKYIGTTNVIWEQKEKQEQQFVTDFILENLKTTVAITKVSEPYTVKAGNLVHIRTDIFGKLKSLDLLENLINSLHPTPAVCGLPKKVATKFILENEVYSRAYYSGYLGELNVDNSTNLFVNLRCMNIDKKCINLFVGGGITIDSNPVKEWEETVSKAQIMKSIL